MKHTYFIRREAAGAFGFSDSACNYPIREDGEAIEFDSIADAGDYIGRELDGFWEVLDPV